MNRSLLAWPFCPTPVAAELLSSYLVRIAHAHGAKPHGFFALHFPGVQFWTRDIDRSISSDMISSISQYCGVHPAVLESMTLRSWQGCLSAGAQVEKAKSICPWINAYGVWHRLRKRHAMQYCPQCLNESATFLKSWRLSFVTVCRIHRRSLQDSCMACDSPVTLHRTAVITQCYACGNPLASATASTETQVELRQRLALQTIFLRLLHAHPLDIANGMFSSSTLFRSAQILLQAAKDKLRKHQPLHLLDQYQDCATARMELLRLPERSQQCLLLMQLIKNWRKEPIAALGRTRRKGEGVRGLSHPLEWVRILKGSPEKGPRLIGQASSPIRRELQQIHRAKRAGWRIERAKILLKAARI